MFYGEYAAGAPAAKSVRRSDNTMKTYEGKSVFGGVAIGKVLVYKKGEQQVKRLHVDDTQRSSGLRMPRRMR